MAARLCWVLQNRLSSVMAFHRQTAFKNMIAVAAKMIETDLMKKIKASFTGNYKRLSSMNLIFSYLQDYFRNVDKWLLLFCSCFAAVFLTLNYRFGIETKWLYNMHSSFQRFAGFYLCIRYCIYYSLSGGCIHQAYAKHLILRRFGFYYLLPRPFLR